MFWKQPRGSCDHKKWGASILFEQVTLGGRTERHREVSLVSQTKSYQVKNGQRETEDGVHSMGSRDRKQALEVPVELTQAAELLS